MLRFVIERKRELVERDKERLTTTTTTTTTKTTTMRETRTGQF